MVKCDECGSEVPSDAKFCQYCGNPMASREAGVTLVIEEDEDTIRIVCPKCETQTEQPYEGVGRDYRFTCPKCGKDFASRVMTVRAKRSRSNKKDNKRTFSIRVSDASGQEEMIEFVNAGTQDFELRSRDVAVFTYIGNELKIVQNANVGQFMKVSKPACYLVSCVYGGDSTEVEIMREFRDDVLLKSLVFRPMVAIYYALSPLIAKTLGQVPWFNNMLRRMIQPLVSYASSRKAGGRP